MADKYEPLKQYILRRLGILDIEITDEQLNDCIDKALYCFHADHYDGAFIGYGGLSLQTGVTKYKLDDNIQEVLNIVTHDNLNFNSWDSDNAFSSYDYMVTGDSIFRTSIVDLEVFNQKYKMLSKYFTVPILFDYNSISKTLYLTMKPTENKDVFLKVMSSDDDEVAHYLTDKWVKDYASALARKQWGINLMKYEAVNLPGGSQFNYQGIIEMAEKEIEKYEIELRDKYTMPLDMFMY